METGKLTPRSNDVVAAMRFTGNFGQPDGFASVLTAQVTKDGELALTLTWRTGMASLPPEQTWSVRLTSEQRRVLRGMLGDYEPTTFERLL